MRSRPAFAVAAALGTLLLLSTSWAAPKGSIRLSKLSCVMVRDGLVYDLDKGKSPRIYPPEVFRCSVVIAVTGDARPVTMTMTAKQDGEGKESPVTAEATQEVHVSPGSQTAELSVGATEKMVDCFPVTLTVAVGKVSRSLEIAPVDCDD